VALFSKNVITQVSGFDAPLITGELVYNQRWYWNLTLLDVDDQPINLSTATITADIVRRQVSNLIDTRNGLSFDVANYTPLPTPINLTISNKVNAAGSFTLVIDDTVWGLINSDPQLNIDAQNPACFTGKIKIAFAANSPTPAEDNIIFLMFLVRSDGVVVV
jgi:phage-related protein